MSSINFAKALCLAVTATLAVASIATPASARWAGQNERHDQYRGGQQGWNGNGNYYRAPPTVYEPYGYPQQSYGYPGYYAPPLVYGSGLNFNISIP